MTKLKFQTLEPCPRCGNAHNEMFFDQFDRPIVDGNGQAWTHWSKCPLTQEPILTRRYELTEPEFVDAPRQKAQGHTTVLQAH